ncbi:MAG: hypothetical protein WKG07_04905 [Hymenobacter sp.]
MQQVKVRLKAAIESLKTLRCVIIGEERIGTKHILGKTAVKLANDPLRVYIKTQKAIEVLYVTGQNDGQAWVSRRPFLILPSALIPTAR